MQPFDSLDRLERLTVLDRIVSPLRAFVQSNVQPQELRDLLHGVPLGHPLHPVLVQVPIGAWASAAVLDFLPGTGPSVTALITIGMATAAPAAISGLTDWSDLNSPESRTGVVHAAANAAALAFYVASLLARARGQRARGKLLGLLGLTAVGVGGTIGGHLSFRRAAGANHTADIPDLVPSDWVEVAALDDLPDGKITVRQVGSVPVLLLRRERGVQALVDRCSHLSGPLHEGRLADADGEACVVCPWHGSTFRLRDGAVVHGPATAPQPVFDARVLSDRVEVRLRPAG